MLQYTLFPNCLRGNCAEQWDHILGSSDGHFGMGRHTIWWLHMNVRIICEYPHDVKRQRSVKRKKDWFSPPELQIGIFWYQDWLQNAAVSPEQWERPYASLTGRGLNGNAKVQDPREWVGCDEEVDQGAPYMDKAWPAASLGIGLLPPVDSWLGSLGNETLPLSHCFSFL